jgi:predicted RNA-binding Zn-ribbon protein involved in translation (DUF1610 family)
MTSEQAGWLDGNGVAGLLTEIHGSDMTTARRVCASCGDRSAVGEHRAYEGAGVVLRCPNCSDVAMRIVVRDDGYAVQFFGTWLLNAAGDPGSPPPAGTSGG